MGRPLAQWHLCVCSHFSTGLGLHGPCEYLKLPDVQVQRLKEMKIGLGGRKSLNTTRSGQVMPNKGIIHFP